MFLSADQIEGAVRGGALRIEPFDRQLLKPTSYVLRLGDGFRRWDPAAGVVDPWAPDASSAALGAIERGPEIVLRPGEFVLAETLETISMPSHLVGLLSTLSHWGRFGLSADNGSWLVSAGYGAGAPTRLTLELVSTNPLPLRLRAGLPVCHLLFARADSAHGESGPLARSVYEGLETPSPPQLFEEFHALVGPEPNGVRPGSRTDSLTP